MTPHTRKRKARERECWMGRDEAPAMAPVRPPWRLQACSVRARASDVVQETHDEAQSACHDVIEKVLKYRLPGVFLCLFYIPLPFTVKRSRRISPFHDVIRSIVVVTRRLVAVRSVLVSCSLGSTDAHRATRRCATFRARYSSPWCSYAPPPPNSRRRRRPAARRSRHSPSLRRRPSHRRRHRLAPRRQASRGRERSARAAEEKSCTTAMWCTPTPLKFASQ